jgi:hypothetical protein
VADCCEHCNEHLSFIKEVECVTSVKELYKGRGSKIAGILDSHLPCAGHQNCGAARVHKWGYHIRCLEGLRP